MNITWISHAYHGKSWGPEVPEGRGQNPRSWTEAGSPGSPGSWAMHSALCIASVSGDLASELRQPDTNRIPSKFWKLECYGMLDNRTRRLLGTCRMKETETINTHRPIWSVWTSIPGTGLLAPAPPFEVHAIENTHHCPSCPSCPSRPRRRTSCCCGTGGCSGTDSCGCSGAASGSTLCFASIGGNLVHTTAGIRWVSLLRVQRCGFRSLNYLELSSPGGAQIRMWRL